MMGIFLNGVGGKGVGDNCGGNKDSRHWQHLDLWGMRTLESDKLFCNFPGKAPAFLSSSMYLFA